MEVTEMQKLISSYEKNGVDVFLQNDGIIKSARIVYDGLLPKSGATDVYAHVGYVSESSLTGNKVCSWSDVKDVKMRNVTGNAFEAVMPLERGEDTLCVTFKDSAQNWDNNAGEDYRFSIG